MNYLFILTISPVQEFISQARKTKDLFAGSEILSDIVKNTIKRAKNQYKAKVIYPQDIEIVSNKFILELKNPNIENVGEELEEYINNSLYFLGSKILLQQQGIKINTTLIEKSFKPQLCNFFQIFWVAIEYKENSHDYKEKYEKLEQSLGAIKNLRVFNQQEEVGARKCLVCGERNGLFYKRDKNNKKPKFVLKDAIEIKTSMLKENETLCAVCFTKRFYEKNSYSSTAKIALLDWLEGLNYDELKNLEDENGEKFDEQWFFEYEKKNEDIKKRLNKWFERYENELQERKQKSYYALIQLDIDDMGKILNGLDKEQQEKLSTALANFSKKIGSEVLTSQKGQTIYAGGDDFLGLVNLKHLFETLKKIQEAFQHKVKTLFPDLTYSVGIVIAHYKEPLHIVLKEGKNSVNFAKEISSKKDGLAIFVLKKSGENLKARIKNSQENIENISKIINLIQKYFSGKFITNLQLEFRNLINKKDRLIVSKEILEIEFKRLIKNSLLDEHQKDKVNGLNNMIKPFITHRNMNNLFSLLEIIRFMKRGV